MTTSGTTSSARASFRPICRASAPGRRRLASARTRLCPGPPPPRAAAAKPLPGPAFALDRRRASPRATATPTLLRRPPPRPASSPRRGSPPATPLEPPCRPSSHATHNTTTRSTPSPRAARCHYAQHAHPYAPTRTTRRGMPGAPPRLVVLYNTVNRAAALRHLDEAKPPLMAAELGHRRPPSPPSLPAYK
ncbi:hypothetical protein PVAP13_5KG304907 [Panicum virgatum]|uniref:Uncharacterized protein n=1 Tax=Panicum virgatum TaxID=38727 RepID=A0A8T0SH93_PANVG|nr:hypothetical protein PVAP13_5KG304907 [Panicum virgatum]